MKTIFNKILALMSIVILMAILSSCHKSYVENGPNVKSNGEERFIAYDNGTVMDTKTNLMWAAKDNGSDIGWSEAKFYCENYRGGGFKDWRMPTLDELVGLYNAHKARPAAGARHNNIHVATELIDITGLYLWASETSTTTNEGAIFDFNAGIRSAFAINMTMSRALPVRYVK